MSNALAISGVSAVLQYCLTQVYGTSSALAGVTVTAQAPDLVAAFQAGNSPPLQVNLFMHQVTPNPAWRNANLPSMNEAGNQLLRNPLVALDLHYLVTFYASEDLQAEALLGYGVAMLYDKAILTRGEIRMALSNVAKKNPLWTALTTSGLAEQIEMIKITPSTLSREEVAWLWTALRCDYRPSFSFQVSVVLIESPSVTSSALPVFSPSIVAQGGSLADPSAGLTPHLLAVQPPSKQTAFTPGETVTLSGQALSGASLVALMNPRLGIWYPPFAPATATAASLSFVIPDHPSTPLPAGFYNLWLIFNNASGVTIATTNILPLPIAPRIVTLSTGVAGSDQGTLVVLECDPQALPIQAVSLSLAGLAVPAQTFAGPTASLTFQFPPPSLAGGSYVAQLRVDGVDSPLSLPPTLTGPTLTI